jgi:hypothetical protein
MQDRIANHPNRWVLTPVTGQTNTYDFTRADDPTVTGTPLNKATFLTDDTASAIAALTGTTPDLPTEALTALATVLSGLGASSLVHVETGSYTGTGTAGSGGSGTANSLTFSYKPRLVIIVQAGGSFATSQGDGFMWQNPNTAATNNVVSLNDKMLSWITTSTTTSTSTRAKAQMNTSGQTYYYIALGVE